MDLVGRTGGRENQEAMSPRMTGDSLRPARPGSSKGLAGGGCFEETDQGREVTLCVHLEMGRVEQLM